MTSFKDQVYVVSLENMYFELEQWLLVLLQYNIYLDPNYFMCRSLGIFFQETEYSGHLFIEDTFTWYFRCPQLGESNVL